VQVHIFSYFHFKSISIANNWTYQWTLLGFSNPRCVSGLITTFPTIAHLVHRPVQVHTFSYFHFKSISIVNNWTYRWTLLGFSNLRCVIDL